VPYRLTFRPLPRDEGSGYLIEFPDLPGCMSDGETIDEAITDGIDAMRGWIDAMRAEGHSIPAPTRSAAEWAAGATVPLAEVAAVIYYLCSLRRPTSPMPRFRSTAGMT
jgi:predicted RNase H-like HicB family nuclease